MQSDAPSGLFAGHSDRTGPATPAERSSHWSLLIAVHRTDGRHRSLPYRRGTAQCTGAANAASSGRRRSSPTIVRSPRRSPPSPRSTSEPAPARPPCRRCRARRCRTGTRSRRTPGRAHAGVVPGAVLFGTGWAVSGGARPFRSFRWPAAVRSPWSPLSASSPVSGCAAGPMPDAPAPTAAPAGHSRTPAVSVSCRPVLPRVVSSPDGWWYGGKQGRRNGGGGVSCGEAGGSG